MKYVVDRLEGNYIKLEGEKGVIDLKKSELGFNVEEGDIINYDGNKFTLDPEYKKQRENYIDSLYKSIFTRKDE